VAEEPEKRMLFDLRGRRKRVIQVIYVFLAVIMVASLVVIGLPGGGFNSGNTQADIDAAQVQIDRAENLQKRVAADKTKLGAQAELIRARVSAGNTLRGDPDPTTGQAAITPKASEQYDLAAEAWDAYVKSAEGDADPAVALLMAQTFSSLSVGGTVARFESNSVESVKAQKIVVEDAKRQFQKGEGPVPTNQLLQLAFYQYLAQDTAAADATSKQALATLDAPGERKQVRTQLKQAERQGQFIARQLKQAKKQARQDGGQSLQEPAGSLGAQDSLPSDAAGTGTP
jgi:hypothetical protein